MLDRFNRFNATRKQKDHRSKLEDEVEQALLDRGLSPKYEPDKFDYTLHRQYCPDFKIGEDINVYIEVKGWWPSSERMKFLSVIRNNPELRIFVALQRPNQRLSKQSKTTLAQWCQKQGINWSPIPIPPDFIDQWLNGKQATFPCPSCESSDAATIYPDGSLFCFSCQGRFDAETGEPWVGKSGKAHEQRAEHGSSDGRGAAPRRFDPR